MSDVVAVLDSSAILALLFAEEGSAAVEAMVRRPGSAVSAVNLYEVLGKLADHGCPAQVAQALSQLPITVVPFDASLAAKAAALRPRTRSLGLGLGDLACLATALHMNAPAVTADRQWQKLLPDVNVVLIRST